MIILLYRMSFLLIYPRPKFSFDSNCITYGCAFSVPKHVVDLQRGIFGANSLSELALKRDVGLVDIWQHYVISLRAL
jgi:hypothetical protein